jgi:hypothetical protein
VKIPIDGAALPGRTRFWLAVRVGIAVALMALWIGTLKKLAGQAPHCGVERWNVKTLTDPARDSVDLAPIPTTIDSLRSLPTPDVRHVPDRVPTEYHVFMVRAVLLGWKLESDSDIHLVIAAPGDTTRTMIAEFPNIACAATDVARVYQGMLESRRKAIERLGKSTAKFKHFAAHPVAIVTGVAFFDFIHGQTGVSPNGIELHPVVSIAFEGP